MSAVIQFSEAGRRAAGQPLRIALAGNPNCGKTTVFNAYTGARQHVGNYPGVTVDRKEGVVRHVFTNEARQFYDLERLWGDGEQIPLSEILEQQEK